MKIKILKADTHINEPPQTQKFQLCQMKCWIRSSANFFPTHTSVVQFFCRQHVLFKCMMYVCISSVAKLCPTLLWPHGLQPAKPPVHGLSQARILEWVAISSSRGSSWPRDWTHVSCVSCTAGRLFTTEPLGKPIIIIPEFICLNPLLLCQILEGITATPAPTTVLDASQVLDPATLI